MKIADLLKKLKVNIQRITADGVQQSENELVSAAQWEAVEEFFRNPQLKEIFSKIITKK